jgi:outer membrane receptor protein involved in Fe transport
VAIPCLARTACLVALAASAQAQAQAPAGNPVQQVEVVGTTPLPGLGVAKDRIASPVQTATGDEISRSQAADLTQFMNRRLGSVHLNEVQNNPFQPDLNYRGFVASPLLGSAQGLSVYLDGVRLNQPFGDVMSWDLIPKSAIATMSLMPGSNPLFGLNTLGGALALQTKDGLRNKGHSVQLRGGAHGRVALEFESGGSAGTEGQTHWFVTGNQFHEKGWRVESPSDVSQLFGKFGFGLGHTRFTLSTALAETRLNGNGLQEVRLLAADRTSVYSKPDTTRNRSGLLNLAFSHDIGNNLSFTGQVYWRGVNTRTYNGDVNDDALDQSVYQPNATERAALAAAGYSGFPTSGETAANTPFPKWRCIANALLRDEPGEKCNGLINQSYTRQHNAGFALQLGGQGPLGALRHQWLAGVALDSSRVRFTQGSELGYLTADHGIVGVGAFGDGITGGDVDGEPYDTRVSLRARNSTASLYASDVLALNAQTHLTVSGRYNRTTVKTRDDITPGGGPGSLDGHHRFSRLNPALGLTFAASPALTVYAGFNQGSRAPSAIELGCADAENPCKLPNAMAGDPPLKQVVTSTVEAGVRGARGGRDGLRWNLGLFRADNRDDILFVADNAAGFGYFKNFGRTRRQGVEAGLSTPTLFGSAGFNYTFLDATFRSPEVVGGEGNSSNSEAAEEGLPGVEGTISIQPGHRLPLVPRHLLKVFGEVRLAPGWSVGADITAVAGSFARGNENNGHQPDGVYYLGPGRTAGYAVLNLTAEWKPMPGLTVFALVNNATGKRYHTAAQLGATAFNARGNYLAQPFRMNAEGDRPLVGSTFLAPGAPRSVYLGLRYAFGTP